MKRNIFIQNDRISLVECIGADYLLMYDSWHDPDVILGYNYRLPYTYDEYAARCASSETWSAAIIRNADGAVIGRIGLSAGLPDLTITIFKSYRGQGYGTAAFALGAKYCIETLKLGTIYAGCYGDNTASRKMIEKCGFRPHPGGDIAEPHILTGQPRVQRDFVIKR